MHLVTAALLGAIQGFTEFLPVSSTAHLLIAERLFGFSDPGSVFTITIQFGSILAVMWLYRARLAAALAGSGPGGGSRRFLIAVLVASVPALIAGYVWGDAIKRVLHESPRAIAIAFIAGGAVMLMVERLRPAPEVREAEQTSIGRAVAIGLMQTLALIPGVSRSGATMVGGLLMRLERSAAAEFSFFLAIPTLAAACGHDLWRVRDQLSADRGAEIAVGFLMAFVAAAVVVRPFVRIVSRAGFAPFAWYRIVAGGAILAALGQGWL